MAPAPGGPPAPPPPAPPPPPLWEAALAAATLWPILSANALAPFILCWALRILVVPSTKEANGYNWRPVSSNDYDVLEKLRSTDATGVGTDLMDAKLVKSEKLLLHGLLTGGERDDRLEPEQQ